MKRFPLFKTSLLSRLFGAFATKSFPPFLQAIINRLYVRIAHVDLTDFEPAISYQTLNKLFTRHLKTPRTIPQDITTIISPCDGFISAFGTIQESLALQIKGFSYSVKELLGDYISKQNKVRLEEGFYLNFYLSPKDYHRYHAPCDMRITKAVHIPGKLYPVNFTWLRKIDALFVENERVVLECFTKDNTLFYMIFVGALNVGKMAFTFDDTIQTNVKNSLQQCYTYDSISLEKGEELGHFCMGSTIVMLFEKNSFIASIKENISIQFGHIIGTK
ncbi:MAG: phosphatidylserine decarboxylase [Sulfurospirillaceae bacterium]|nr:phosphatidylserine decarboxylase [Sulfurospirillaceae bacterium]